MTTHDTHSYPGWPDDEGAPGRHRDEGRPGGRGHRHRGPGGHDARGRSTDPEEDPIEEPVEEPVEDDTAEVSEESGRGGRRRGPKRGPSDRRRGGRGRRGSEEEHGHGGPPWAGRRGERRGFGRPGGWQQGDLPPVDDAESWFTGRLPQDWFSEVEVSVDREEIVVIGTIADSQDLASAEAEGRISRFRSDTRETRMEIADEAQDRYRRKVSWGARAGEANELFTHISVPVMTRLKQPERQVLDTLVDAGVARSRSEALSWAVKLVGEHADTWLADLRNAMSEVDKLRSEGPDL